MCLLTIRLIIMKLILLSGGSGKRLWPLSNDARSKQFLPLLKSPDGTMESMLQRIVRQISQSGITDHIIVATNNTQKDVVDNQVGSNVAIVTEPERRNTFAAVVLTAAYLNLEKCVSEDEILVVMPCDPFTTLEYYDTISKMAKSVESGKSNMALMSIPAKYSSTRYGYIMADDQGNVQRFIECVAKADAEYLISQGAMWNGGVSAFKIGYIRQIAEKFISWKNYSDVRANYNKLPDCSFDTMVVAKEKKSVAFSFEGAWKDLGSWNTITEELAMPVMGNATLGKNTNNTQVINELGVPVYCNGVDDVIVAASPNGILVSAKKDAESIMEYVDTLTERPMYEERRWGSYCVLNSQEFADGFKALTKTITLNPGKNISYQIHHHRSEIWSFIDGEGLFVKDGEVIKVKRGDVVNIPAEHFHAVRALSKLTFIEVQQGGPLVEEDIERFEFDWDKAISSIK